MHIAHLLWFSIGEWTFRIGSRHCAAQFLNEVFEKTQLRQIQHFGFLRAEANEHLQLVNFIGSNWARHGLPFDLPRKKMKK